MKRITAVILLLTGCIIGAYATALYYSRDKFQVVFTKGDYFRIVLGGNPASQALSPGDSFTTEPAIQNFSTGNVFCFIKVIMPAVDEGGRTHPIYDYTVGDEWSLVKEATEDGLCSRLYAYSYTDINNNQPTMKPLLPQNTTSPLTSEMTLNVTDAFIDFDDTTMTLDVIGIGISTAKGSLTPASCWNAYIAESGNNDGDDF